jgi:hypothetical protein
MHCHGEAELDRGAAQVEQAAEVRCLPGRVGVEGDGGHGPLVVARGDGRGERRQRLAAW